MLGGKKNPGKKWERNGGERKRNQSSNTAPVPTTPLHSTAGTWKLMMSVLGFLSDYEVGDESWKSWQQVDQV